MSGADDTDARVTALVDALLADDDEEEERDTVEALGIDLGAFASALRDRVSEHRARERQARYAEAEAARDAELDRLEREPLPLPELSREERMSIARELLQRAGPRAGMHYMKFQEATDAELNEMIRTLRHLIEKGDADS